MDRLTHKDASGKYVITNNKFDNWFELKLPLHLSGEAVNKLVEYEDQKCKSFNTESIEESIFALEEIRNYFKLDVKCRCNDEDGICDRCMYIEDLRVAIQKLNSTIK